MTARRVRPARASTHAVARFVERWRPWMTHGEARQTLELYAERGAEWVEDEDGGQSIWRIPQVAGGQEHPADLLLVVDDAGEIRTVLPFGAQRPMRRPKHRGGKRKR